MTDVSTPGSDMDSPLPPTNGVAPTIETNGHATDSDEDIQTKSARKRAASDDDEEPELENGDNEDVGDLFGSESEGEENRPTKRRKLSDEELDSGDDEGRRDRVGDEDIDTEDGEQTKQKEVFIARVDLGRHGMPHGSDGELYLLRHPVSMGIEPKVFTPQSFRPPTGPHHGAAPTSAFSAAQVANSTIRWRRDPDNPTKLQSNARIIRWSDGSLTLQLGANPMEQHELPAKSLAPPSKNPPKPIPRKMPARYAGYDNRLETHTYLGSLHNLSGFVQITNHLTASLTVQSTNDEDDEALIRLQEALGAATKGNKGETSEGPGLISIKEDPELAKRKAEVAEREKQRAERRRQNQAERERDRANRVLGPSRGRSGGLTVGGLEDDDGMRPSRGKGGKGKRRPRRRNSEYSEDEEDGYIRGKTKEDEYDKEDDFVAASDEELEIADDGSEEEEEFGEADAEGEEEEEETPKPAKADEPQPAAGDDDDAAGGARGRRRRVVDEDEED